METKPVLVMCLGVAIVFILEFISQIGVGKYPVTTVLYAQQISKSGHLNAVTFSQPLNWRDYTWIDSALPLPSILTLEFARVLGIGLDVMPFLPIGVLFLIPYFVLAFRLSGRILFAAIFLFGYLIPIYGFDAVQQLNRVSLGWDLLGFLFLLLLVQGAGRKGTLLLSALLLLAMDFTYYTTAALGTGLVFSFALYASVGRGAGVKLGKEWFANARESFVLFIVAIAGFVESSALVVVSRNGANLTNPIQLLTVAFGDLFGSIFARLGIGPVSVFPNAVPIPAYLAPFRPIQSAVTASLALMVISWGLYGAVVIVRRSGQKTLLEDWRVPLAWGALAMALVGVIGYASVNFSGPLGTGIASLGMIGFLLLIPPRNQGGASSRSRQVFRLACIIVIALVLISSGVTLVEHSTTGFTGVHPYDGTLYLPVSHFYARYSTGYDFAAASFVLSSMLALYPGQGSSIQTLQANIAISTALSSRNGTELLYAMQSTKANIYALTTRDIGRTSWGDAYGYIASSMNYGPWFFDQTMTQIVYSNGATAIDLFGQAE